MQNGKTLQKDVQKKEEKDYSRVKRFLFRVGVMVSPWLGPCGASLPQLPVEMQNEVLSIKEITGKCDDRIKCALQPGEVIKDTKKTTNYTFVLTDNDIIIAPDHVEPIIIEGMKFTPLPYRVDIADVTRGLISWEATDDACYFLTDRAILTIMPVDKGKDKMYQYLLPFETKGVKNPMVLHSGFVFIAGEGKLFVIKYVETPDYRAYSVSSHKDAKFYKRDGTLFYGEKNTKEDIEIKVEGKTPNDVRILLTIIPKINLP